MRKMLSLLALAAVLALPAQAKVTRYLTGNAADVVVPLAGPAHDFGGGGTDVDAALQWIIDPGTFDLEAAAEQATEMLMASLAP